MSLENKIRELMEAKKAKASALNEAAAGKSGDGEGMNAHKQGDSQAATYTEIDPYTGSPKGEDSSLKKGPSEPKVKQGDSKDAEVDDIDSMENGAKTTPDTSIKKGNSEPQAKQGNSRAATVKTATAKATGETSTYETPTNPGEGQIPFKEDEDLDIEDVITEEDLEEDVPAKRSVQMNLESLRADIASVFSGDENLSEEFKTQAAAIFEAAVVARVNNEIEAITEELAEQAASEIESIKEGLVEKVDSYLNYVVEQWMKENEVAVDRGLRTEVAEDFMFGLKNLFQEHYFEVPEDKIDVLDDMASKVDAAQAELDEAIQANVEMKTQLEAVMRERIIEQAGRDLTATDAEKLGKLLEGVEFDNQALFEQKVKVIKENYFAKSAPNSPEKMLEESVQHGDKATQEVPAHIQRYVESISRSVKK
jgi:hypothetical protein